MNWIKQTLDTQINTTNALAPRSDLIYKLLDQEQWLDFSQQTSWQGNALDRKDNFIHLSQDFQIMHVLTKFYPELQQGYLVAFSLDKLKDIIEWDTKEDGARFPHAYGVLKVADASQIWQLDTQQQKLTAIANPAIVDSE